MINIQVDQIRGKFDKQPRNNIVFGHRQKGAPVGPTFPRIARLAFNAMYAS